MNSHYLRAFLTRFENNEKVDQKDLNEFFINFGPVFLTKSFDTELNIKDEELKILKMFQNFGKHIYSRCIDISEKRDNIELELAANKIKLKGVHETFKTYQKRKKELKLEIQEQRKL